VNTRYLLIVTNTCLIRKVSNIKGSVTPHLVYLIRKMGYLLVEAKVCSMR
jgi:hypothetical protein